MREQEMRERARTKLFENWPTSYMFTFAEVLEEMEEFATLERAEARRETIEECAKRVEAMTGSLAVSEDRARSAGRHGVADCRQSDIETCERAAANIRALTPAPEAEKGQKI